MNPLEPKPSASTNSAIPARAQCDQVFHGWQVANAKIFTELNFAGLTLQVKAPYLENTRWFYSILIFVL